ncbi:MAG: hypothetical protein AB9866_11025 [Syntrophobacteraceae bacterium]
MAEMTTLHTELLRLIARRDSSDPVSYQDLAVALGVNPRKIRQAVEDLVMIHKQPICSSYNSRRPGYYWPRSKEEIIDSGYRLIRHGVRIIKRGQGILRWSEEEVMGQLPMFMREEANSEQ